MLGGDLGEAYTIFSSSSCNLARAQAPWRQEPSLTISASVSLAQPLVHSGATVNFCQAEVCTASFGEEGQRRNFTGLYTSSRDSLSEKTSSQLQLLLNGQNVTLLSWVQWIESESHLYG